MEWCGPLQSGHCAALVAFLLVLLLGHEVCGIRNVRLLLPAAVQAGQPARLICLYDLEGAPLYSLKWYRGRREFFRYVPKQVPPTKVFPFPGINVDLSQSTANQVELQNIQASLSGNYSCEVSADAPSFSTAFVSHYMTVVELPERRPSIWVDKSSVQAGQQLTANCSSPRSSPPANLTFFINDIPIKEDHVLRPPEETEGDGDGQGPPKQGPWLSFTTTVTREQLVSGLLRLRCVASVLMFHRHAELAIEEERPHLLVLGAREQTPNTAPATLASPAWLLLLATILRRFAES